jgi:hypothetical protein
LSSELTCIRNELAKDSKEFLEKEREQRRREGWGMKSNNLQFNPKIIFMYGLPTDRSNEIIEELRNIFPRKTIIVSAKALGLRSEKAGALMTIEASLLRIFFLSFLR